MRKLIYVTLLLAATSHAQTAIQTDSHDDRERAQYDIGSPSHKWSTAQFNWYYNPQLQPSNLTTDAVVSTIQAAAARWSGMCNISFNYLGTTTNAPNIYGVASTVDYRNVIGWGLPQGADLSSSMLTYKKWWAIDSNFMVDTDIMFNIAKPWTRDDLDGAATAALGAVIGLNNSNVSASVLANDPTRSSTYLRTLRGDDAAGCAALYGAASTAQSNRAFNWAEATYPQLLSPSPAASGNALGYYYRFYATTNSYVGTKDGSVFYMGPNGVIQNMGALSTYTSQVQSAGF